MAAAQHVLMFAFSSCNSMELKRFSGLGDTCKLSFRSYFVMYRRFTFVKTDAENCHTYPRVQTDSGTVSFSFLWPTRETAGGQLTCV